ncbi:iron ABC transporter permease [Sporolactobacillus sp. THM7-7]|nr:iron ABC transporter permease [Sporolactobacillus sp. THM7-7]
MESIQDAYSKGKGSIPERGLPSFLLKRTFPFILAFVFLLFVFLLPLYRLISLSFVSDDGLTIENYTRVLGQPATWNVFMNTLMISGGATVIAVLLGVGFAWLIAYTNVRGKRLMQMFIILPFVIPSYVTTLAWTQFLGANGLAAKWLALLPGDLKPWNLYSLSGMIFVLGLTHYPLVYFFTMSVFRKIPRELEEAARASGGSKYRIFWRMTLPLALPGIVNGGFLAFLASLDNFGIPAFLGIPAHINVLSTYIYQQIVGFGPNAFARASVLSVLLGALALLGMLVQWGLLKKFKPMETAREDKAPRYYLGKFKKRLLEYSVWAFFLVTSVMPLLSMMMTSLISAYGLDFQWKNISLKNYAFILSESPKTKQALINSFQLALVTTLAGMAVGTIFAYLHTHKPSKWMKTLEMIIGLPYALPGTVMALSMILAWMEPIPGWNPGIYGSIMILFIAYFTRFLILQVRGSMTAILQVDSSIEEAARVSGTNGWAKWRRILIPLYTPGILSGAFLVFLTALTELTVSALLYSAQSETIGVVIFGFEQAGYTTYSTAFSSFIVLLILAGFCLLYSFETIRHRRETKDHDHKNRTTRTAVWRFSGAETDRSGD